MAWLQLQTRGTAEAIDWIQTLLATSQYSGEIQIQPIDAQDPQSTPNSDLWRFQIQLILPESPQMYRQIDQITQQLASLQRTGMIDEWETTIAPDRPTLPPSTVFHRVGRFVLLPPHANPTLAPTEHPIVITPSPAFGSGFHPATHLCLQLIERCITPGMNVLDVGCGSGILSVAMARLGAVVTAIDNDPQAIAATQVMIQQNKLGDRITPILGSLGQGVELGHWMGGESAAEGVRLPPEGNFDAIVANLFARIHIQLVSDYYQALRQTSEVTGLIITAGYDIDYVEEINHTFSVHGLKLKTQVQQHPWIAAVHEREGTSC